MPHPTGYGDATVTYILRVKISSYTYAKQVMYSQELEYESTVVLYIPTLQSKYIVITGCDPILQEYYIIKGYKI